MNGFTRELHGLALFLSSLLGFAAGADVPTVAIAVDQAGYRTKLAKLAMVVDRQAGESGGTFEVRRVRDNSAAFQGKLGTPATDEHSGDVVRTADFSKLEESGTFYLFVPGLGRSWTFPIGADVYAPVYKLAMRSFYGQRCGTKVDMGPEFPQYTHAICHTEGAYDSSSGKTGSHSSARGWHDAGDYGRYVVNSGISTGTLLWTWEMFGDRIKQIGLQIPESGNGTPDILSEIRWNLDWMLSMQDADGGVFHKQTSTHFSGFITPEQDKLPSVVIGTGSEPYKNSCATADLATVAAIAARNFKPYDSAYAAQTLEAANKAWVWLQMYENVTFGNPPGITTGAYGDRDCSDERLWASAELWRTTRQELYQQYFLAHYQKFLYTLRPSDPQSWSQVAPLALWSYVLGGGSDSIAASVIRQSSLEAADAIVQRASRNPYRTSLMTTDYIWGSNGVAANYSMQLLVADWLRPDATYVNAAADNLHYLLGRNTFSLSWVTHVGDHCFQHPHHRLSAADKVDAPWPGLLSGGPNAGRQDSVMKNDIRVDAKPARAYVDETGAYACNEVAINWNAPLVFTLAALTGINHP